MRTPRARSFVTAALAALTVLLTGTLLAACTTSAATVSAGTADAPANTRGFGLPIGDGPVSIDLWTDVSCPYCAQLDALIGPDVAALVEDGTVTWTIHPMTYVSAKRGDTSDYSLRGANLLALVADAGESARLPAVYAALQHAQAEGASIPTDHDLSEIARSAGVTTDLSEGIADQPFAEWARSGNDHWGRTAPDGLAGPITAVPTLVVAGEPFEIRGDGTDLERLLAAVEAAR